MRRLTPGGFAVISSALRRVLAAVVLLCSRGRVFCNAVAVAVLFADTPYKAGMFDRAAVGPAPPRRK